MAYETTTVPVERSQGEIRKLLTDYDASRFAFGEETDSAGCAGRPSSSRTPATPSGCACHTRRSTSRRCAPRRGARARAPTRSSRSPRSSRRPSASGASWRGTSAREHMLATTEDRALRDGGRGVEHIGPLDPWPPAVSDGLTLPCADCGAIPPFDYLSTLASGSDTCRTRPGSGSSACRASTDGAAVPAWWTPSASCSGSGPDTPSSLSRCAPTPTTAAARRHDRSAALHPRLPLREWPRRQRRRPLRVRCDRRRARRALRRLVRQRDHRPRAQCVVPRDCGQRRPRAARGVDPAVHRSAG